MSEKNITPCRPYLLQAYLDWILANQLTPHLIVDATVPLTQIPREYVQDGRIVLDIAEDAVRNFKLIPSSVSFSAFFGEHIEWDIYLPMASIIGIHAKEHPIGTLFPQESFYQEWIEEANRTDQVTNTSPTLVTESAHPEDSGEDGDNGIPPKPKGPPTLRLIK